MGGRKEGEREEMKHRGLIFMGKLGEGGWGEDVGHFRLKSYG